MIWDRRFPEWINNWFPAYHIPPRDKLIMEPYLVEHYRVVGSTDRGFQFLERKDSTLSAGNRLVTRATQQPAGVSARPAP